MECIVCGGDMKKVFSGEILMKRKGGDVAKMRGENISIYGCKNCGLEALYPQPSDEVLKSIYSDYFSGWGFGDKVLEESVMKAKRKTYLYALRGIKLWKDMKVLDIGAGVGHFASMARDMGISTYAVEFSNFGAKKCREILGENRVFEGDFLSHNFQMKFHLITMFDFIEHVRNPREVLEKSFSILEDNGILIITTPRVDGFLRGIMGKYWLHYKIEHLYYFSRKSIFLLLREIGFGDVQIRTHFKYLNFCYCVNLCLNYPIPFITDLLLKISRLNFLRDRIFIFPGGEMVVIAKKNVIAKKKKEFDS